MNACEHTIHTEIRCVQLNIIRICTIRGRSWILTLCSSSPCVCVIRGSILCRGLFIFKIFPPFPFFLLDKYNFVPFCSSLLSSCSALYHSRESSKSQSSRHHSPPLDTAQAGPQPCPPLVHLVHRWTQPRRASLSTTCPPCPEGPDLVHLVHLVHHGHSLGGSTALSPPMLRGRILGQLRKKYKSSKRKDEVSPDLVR